MPSNGQYVCRLCFHSAVLQLARAQLEIKANCVAAAGTYICKFSVFIEQWLLVSHVQQSDYHS
jgi:hypothetical protein